jgi:hypothetical protein
MMNRLQKAAAAAIALAITLAGATLATAPLALADIHAQASHRVVYHFTLSP